MRGMDFSNALYALRMGHKVKRHSWDRAQWLVLDTREDDHPVIRIHEDDGDEATDAWASNNSDLVAMDWELVDYGAKQMNFGDAIAALKQGEKVARAGWNGKDMFLFLVPGSTFQVNRPPLLGIYPEGTEINYHAHIDMRTATGEIVPWLASQTDVLAEDWELVN